MPQHSRRRPRLAAVAATIALAGAGLVGTAVAAAPAAAAPASGGAAIDTVDYLADTYGLEDTPIETVTFERFEWLLNQPGRFAFLIGGPGDARTTETIASIDAAAKAAGVERVYAFDPRLDGDALDVRTTTNPDVAPLWSRLVSQYLGKDVQTPFGGAADPYFFVYDRAHTDGGAEDRIVSALTAPVAAGALADPSARAAYQAEVAAVIGDGSAIDALSQFAFYDDVVDAKHLAQYRGGEAYGPNTIIDEADADWRIQNITYPELVHLLDSDGDYVLFFGGTWCHNTRAVVKDVNRQAVANGVERVYFFDLRLDGASANDLHIRDTNSEYAHLYGDLVTTYLPNLKTQYVPGVSGQVDYRPGGDAAAGLVTAKKLQVPYVFEYQRGRTVEGQAAPVVREWIRDNGDGSFKEYMTEWWYVNDREGRFATSPDPVKLAEQLAFADEAIAQLDAFFAKVGTGDGTGGPGPVDPEPTDPTTVKGTVAITGQLRPGGTVSVVGSGLATGTAGFSVELHSEPQQLGTVSTDASGAFRLAATIPAATPAGAHTVVVLINGVTVAAAPVTIAAAATGGGTGGGSGAGTGGDGSGSARAGADASGLASTGTGLVDVLGWSALGLLAAGVATFLIARRRRDRAGLVR